MAPQERMPCDRKYTRLETKTPSFHSDSGMYFLRLGKFFSVSEFVL